MSAVVVDDEAVVGECVVEVLDVVEVDVECVPVSVSLRRLYRCMSYRLCFQQSSHTHHTEKGDDA